MVEVINLCLYNLTFRKGRHPDAEPVCDKCTPTHECVCKKLGDDTQKKHNCTQHALTHTCQQAHALMCQPEIPVHTHKPSYFGINSQLQHTNQICKSCLKWYSELKAATCLKSNVDVTLRTFRCSTLIWADNHFIFMNKTKTWVQNNLDRPSCQGCKACKNTHIILCWCSAWTLYFTAIFQPTLGT